MYQNLAYPTDTFTGRHLGNSFINAPRCPQNSWRRPPFPYVRRNMVSGRYINVGVRPITHLANTSMPYKYIPGFKHSVPNTPVVINRPIGQRPQFILVPGNTVGNQNNQHMIPIPNSNERKIATDYSAQYGNNQILSYPMANLPTGINPTFIQRPPFYPVPCNMFHSQNNQSIFPVANNNVCHLTAESTNQKNGPNVFSCLAFQPPASGVGINYYNPKTGESTWNNIVNDRKFESNEVKQSSVPLDIEQFNKIHVAYPNQNIQDQPINRTYVNAVYSNNVSMTAKLIMLPTNICTAPPTNIGNAAPLSIYNVPPPSLFLPPVDMTQKKIANYDIRSTMHPPVFQNSVVSHNPSSNIIINECNQNVTQNVLSSNNVIENNSNVTHNLLSLTETIHNVQSNQNTLSSRNIIYCNQNAIQNHLGTIRSNHNGSATQNQFPKSGMSNFSNNSYSVEKSNNSEKTANSISINDIKKEPMSQNRNAENLNVKALSTNPSLLIKGEKETSKIFEENTMKHRDEKIDDVKNIAIRSIKSEDSIIDKTKCASSVTLNQIKQNNKSRPVCSTPVPGTSWCVVWTGDEKVFFYDSQRKLSIWERPVELLNRSDVDKMVMKNPVSADSKVLTTEVCETLTDDSKQTQKMRKDDQKVAKTDSEENSEANKTNVNANSKNTYDVCGVSGIANSEFGLCSREERIKKFCEMLSENNVSILSSWEKEIIKVIPDPRYSLLTTEERKEVFTDYVKRNLEDEIVKRRRKYQLQKAKFLSLLIEAGVTSEFRFSDIAQRFAEDLRYKAIEDTALKESIFNQYISKLKVEDRENENNKNQRKKEQIKLSYVTKSFDKKKLEVQNTLVKNECCKSINNKSVMKDILKDYSNEKYENIPLAKRQKRINDGLENTQEVIKGHLSVYPKSVEKENQVKKYKLAVMKFKVLLVDKIKNSDISWQTAKNILKADQRWTFSQDLDPEICEHLFKEYTCVLKSKRVHQLHRFLDILPNVTLKPSWLNMPESYFEDARSGRYFFGERHFKK